MGRVYKLIDTSFSLVYVITFQDKKRKNGAKFQIAT